MKKQLSMLAILAGLALPLRGDEPQDNSTTVLKQEELKTTPDDLPDGIRKFNGMLLGRLAAKDVERGTFVVHVDAVPRVWRHSEAENPKSVVGKTVVVGGVFGRFLDVLVVARKGDTVEFECNHDGDQLKFNGELLRKVAPYKPEDYPELPEEFRGFQGAVSAEIVKMDPETFELIVKVHRVTDTWEKNVATKPESIVGKHMMLAGFWNRKDAYYNLKVGDRIEVGVRHIGLRSDHLTVAEFVRKAGDKSARSTQTKESETAIKDGLSKELRGFRGVLVGRLVKKDIERGTFTINVDAVSDVWKNNESSDPKSVIGKNVDAGGVHGTRLDVLIVARVGETVEIGAIHNSGDRLRVVEVLRKVAPVKAGDYPELPDAFRGFKGMLVGKVVKKDEHLLELVIQVKQIKQTFPTSEAKNANSIIGKQVMLAGFWQRKDAFHKLGVGDTIECGIDHPQRLSDHLSVIESVKKVDN